MSVQEKIRNGLVFQEENRLDEAAAAFAEALALRPDEPEILYLLGVVDHQRREYAQAVRWLGRAIGLRPERGAFHDQLGQTLRAMGRSGAALERFREASRLEPERPAMRVNLGGMLQEAGQTVEAVEQYRLALQRDPELVEAHYNLGSAFKALGRDGEAEFHYRAAIRLKPTHFRACYNLGVLLQSDGRNEEGVACFATAWRLRPDYVRARWKMLLDLPVLIDDEARIEPLRARWREGVRLLLAMPLETPEEIREAWEAASTVSNFYLNYHARDDRAEQMLYGRLLTRVARAAYPALGNRNGRPRVPGAPLRVGFVSSFLHGHSIFKTHSRWITGLDALRWVFYTGATRDLSLRYIQERVEHFHAFPPSAPVGGLIEAIVAADLDVLIYTDLGMDARLHPLSALRLAPVQCNGGGHPVTSGVETMDVFISSALMEPENGQEHYSERLLRLPNLGSCYPHPKTAMARVPEEFVPGRVTYVNLQSLYKLLPQHDVVFPRIARAVPGSRFYFIEVTGAVSGQFRERLRRVFARFGLEAEACCRLLPRMGQEAFFGLARSADVILDGIAWSGNNSSLEALAFDVPIVTLAGPFFRSRHTCGILRRIGVEETVAADLDGFVDLAVRLGLDREFRERVRRKIALNKDRLYEDESVPVALGAALRALCGADRRAP
ncbi:MAG: tetratricopeptide repeat protein [Magnetococcales bacterium]|nr:tetratricopeptide repeat protein [Magnetococcales bacterium]